MGLPVTQVGRSIRRSPTAGQEPKSREAKSHDAGSKVEHSRE